MLLKIWFSTISTLLILGLIFLLFYFEINNIIHWLSLFAIFMAIILTVIIYLEKPHKKVHINNHKDIQDIHRTYSDFLIEKDKKIEELQKKNDLLFKTSVKRTEESLELNELKKKWEEKLKEQNGNKP
jgi:hypothetical protein